MALVVFVVGSQVTSWFYSSGWSRTSSSREKPNFITECKSTSSSTFQGALYQGKLHCSGPAITWYQDGQKKSEVHYANPTFSHFTWEIAQCIHLRERKNSYGESMKQFLCDVRDGKETNWSENGQLRSKISWVNNRRTGTASTWYESGQKRSETEYANDNRLGLSTAWYENGQKERECSYVTPGQCITWHKNGQKRSECPYTEQLANVAKRNRGGVQTNWYANGQKSQELVRDEEYGQIISKAFWNEAGGASSNPTNVLLECDPDRVCYPACIRL